MKQKMNLKNFSILDHFNYYCVGSEAAIRDLSNYWTFHSTCDNPVDLDIFLERMQRQHVFCCITGKSTMDKHYATYYNRKLRKAGLLIEEHDFWEAAVASDPTPFLQELNFPKETVLRLIHNNIWHQYFDIDVPKLEDTVNRFTQTPLE